MIQLPAQNVWKILIQRNSLYMHFSNISKHLIAFLIHYFQAISDILLPSESKYVFGSQNNHWIRLVTQSLLIVDKQFCRRQKNCVVAHARSNYFPLAVSVMSQRRKAIEFVDIPIQLHIRLEEHSIEFLTWCFIYRLDGFMLGIGNLLVFRDSCERRKLFEWTKRIYVWRVFSFCKTAASRTFVLFSIRSDESNQRRDDWKMIKIQLKICWRTFGIVNFKFNATNIVVRNKIIFLRFIIM